MTTRKATKSQLEILEHERHQVLAELTRLRNELKTSFEPDDLDDAAADLIERDKLQAIIFSLERKVESIDHAIDQAQTFGYGVCESCGNSIEPERLEIFPETTLCIECKRKTEKQRRY